jgi:hypothetical protein
MKDSYKQALHAAQEELTQLEERRASLLRLIQNLKALSDDDRYELTPPPGYVPQGLTDEVRMVLGLTSVHLSPAGIRDALITRGFKVPSSAKNFLINIHTVLGRLEENGELDIVVEEGRRTFRMKAREEFFRFKAAHDAKMRRAGNVIGEGTGERPGLRGTEKK